MTTKVKPVDELTVDDLKLHPIWEYSSIGERRVDLDETAVRPVKRVPVDELSNRIVGTEVILANGSLIWATLGNVEARNARRNMHFLSLAVERNGDWFVLARYHDLDFKKNGPAALARFLGLSIEEVFPIAYDIRSLAHGDEDCLKGSITVEPRERLSKKELIKLAVW